MPSEPAPVPRYGERSLADVLPSLLAAMGVPGLPNVLGIEPVERACVLLVDGLGWRLLERYAEAAPTLAAAARDAEPITAGFPATTATSLGSLATGLPPGEHGLLGYTMSVPGIPSLGGRDRALECITWTVYGVPEADALGIAPPESVQAAPTLLERATASGVTSVVVQRPLFAGSGLTRATLRGAHYESVEAIDDQVRAVARWLRADVGRAIVSAYYPGVDATGHRMGPGSDPWLSELAAADRFATRIAEQLTPGAALLVTADHGMVRLRDEDKIDLADEPTLSAGVRLLAGEGRARHVHVADGAAADVVAAWRERLGERMWVATRDEAIAAGWFGPTVRDEVRDRIGDVVAAAAGPIGVFERAVDPYQPTLVGHHGSMTSDEQLIPLLVFRG